MMPVEFALPLAAVLCLLLVLGGGLYKRWRLKRWRDRKETMEKRGPDWLERDDEPADVTKDEGKKGIAGNFSLVIQIAAALLVPLTLFFLVRNFQTDTPLDSMWWAILVLPFVIGA